MRVLKFVATIVLTTCAFQSTYAQTARQGGAPNAQLLQQMQQLASERTSLKAENDKLKKDLEDLRKDRDSLKGAQKGQDARAKASEAAVAQSNAQREQTEQELKRAQAQMQELVVKFRETLTQMRDIETDRTTAQQSLAKSSAQLKVCVDRNLALFKISDEILGRLENRSVWSRVATAEPFTRIKRNEMENLVDDYRNRADDQRVTPEVLKSAQPAMPPPGAAPAAPAPSPQR